MKKIFPGITGFLSGIFLLFILFVASFELVCYKIPGFYEKKFREYHVTDAIRQETGDIILLPDLLTVMDQTMLYLRGDRPDLNIEIPINGVSEAFYSADEKSHMEDVRTLFVSALLMRNLFLIGCTLLIGICISFFPKQTLQLLARGCLQVFSSFLLFLLLLSLLTALNFNRAFYMFHRLFFPQGNWLFDVSRSRMVNMLPEAFFADCAFRIGITFFCMILAGMLASYVLLRFMRKNIHD